MPPFAHVDAVAKASVQRFIPVEGGRYGDTVGEGHTFGKHKGVDIYGGDGSRTVRAACDCEVIRVEDARGSDPKSHRGAAGPYWVDTYELGTDGKRTGSVVRYLHLDSVDSAVVRGAIIKAKQKIGTYWEKTFNGNAGHLHFEVRGASGAGEEGYGTVTDPTQWLRGSDDTRPDVIRLVAMLNQQEQYGKVKVGSLLYARSGQRLNVETVSGYPFLVVSSLDKGRPSGNVSLDISDAADWALEDAMADTAYSVRKDGLLGMNAWGYRIRPMSEKVEAAKKLPPEERYKEAWAIRKEIARLRGENFISSQAGAFKAAAVKGGEAVKEGVGAALSSVWENIPTTAKIAGGALALAGGIALFASKD